MKVILVGDQKAAFRLFGDICAETVGVNSVDVIPTGDGAEDFVRQNRDVSFALIDGTMPEALALAERLRALRGDLIVMFLTDSTVFAGEAIRQNADYALFLPLGEEAARDALFRARLLQLRQRKRYRATLFGTFDFTVDGRPMRFGSAKARELMALLVCYRGKPVSIHSIVECLWDGNENADVNTVGYRKVIQRLAAALRSFGASELLERSRGFCRLHAERIECDYYEYLQGTGESRQTFSGVFLPEYPWAEQYIYPMLERQGSE